MNIGGHQQLNSTGFPCVIPVLVVIPSTDRLEERISHVGTKMVLLRRVLFTSKVAINFVMREMY